MRTAATAMSARFTRPKRLARIAMSSWSAETKRALADAERRAGIDVGVPIGDGTAWISGGSDEVEMVSLSSALTDIGSAGAPVVAKINVECAAGSMILGTAVDDWSAVRLLWADVESNDPVGLDEIKAHLARCGLDHVETDGHRNRFVRR